MVESLEFYATSIRPVVSSKYTHPVEEEFARLYNAPLRSHETNSEPPAAGMNEIAYTLMVLAPIVAPLVYKFFEPTVTAAGEAFRDKLLDLIRNARKSRITERAYIPVCIEFGILPVDEYPITPVRYYFHGQIDDEGLLLRLRAADQHLKMLPEEVFSWAGGPSENGFFWDRLGSQWRGRVWHYPEDRSYGEFWLPNDLFDDQTPIENCS